MCRRRSSANGRSHVEDRRTTSSGTQSCPSWPATCRVGCILAQLHEPTTLRRCRSCTPRSGSNAMTGHFTDGCAGHVGGLQLRIHDTPLIAYRIFSNTDGLTMRVAEPKTRTNGTKRECALFVRHSSAPRWSGCSTITCILGETRDVTPKSGNRKGDTGTDCRFRRSAGWRNHLHGQSPMACAAARDPGLDAAFNRAAEECLSNGAYCTGTDGTRFSHARIGGDSARPRGGGRLVGAWFLGRNNSNRDIKSCVSPLLFGQSAWTDC